MLTRVYSLMSGISVENVVTHLASDSNIQKSTHKNSQTGAARTNIQLWKCTTELEHRQNSNPIFFARSLSVSLPRSDPHLRTLMVVFKQINQCIFFD